MTNFENPLSFDHTDYSLAAIKFFLDRMHLIKPEPTDLPTLLEVIDFLHCEGKTSYKSFEYNLAKNLMQSIIRKTLPMGSQLLISLFLSKVDNMNVLYDQNLAESITNDCVANLLYEFDVTSTLNKNLAEMCVQKGVLDDTTEDATDTTEDAVVFALLKTCKKLKELQVVDESVKQALPSSFE